MSLSLDYRILQKHTGSNLKKHERHEKRDPPMVIHPLFLNDGVTPSTLCPVNTLRDYVNNSNSQQNNMDQLFVHPSSGKPLTIPQLRKHIVDIIVKACPGSFPKSHDIRKVAASLALLSNMSLDDISLRTGWSQRKTFWTHYHLSIKKVQKDCVTMGHRSQGFR